jgi:hypothetical protein
MSARYLLVVVEDVDVVVSQDQPLRELVVFSQAKPSCPSSTPILSKAVPSPSGRSWKLTYAP